MNDTPESPPAGPVIPIGLATKLGIAVSVISAVCAALTPLLEGDQTPEVSTLLVTAALAAIRVIDGRMKQAAAAIPYHQPAMHPEPEFIDDDGIVNFDEGHEGTWEAEDGPGNAAGNPGEDPTVPR